MRSTRIVLVIAFLSLFFAGCTAVTLKIDPVARATAQPDAATFGTPEEAITQYLHGIAQNDIGEILQASAVDEVGEKFRLDLVVERLRAFLPTTTLAPTDYPFYAEINKAELTSQILRQVKMFAYSLLSSEETASGAPIMMDAERINTFIRDVDPTRLATITVKRIDALPILNNPKALENSTALAKTYGADNSTERVVLFSFEGKDYLAGFGLLQYGDNWKILSQHSNYAGLSPLGAPQEITVEEYEQLVSGN
jgi:hypothetical protein